MKEKLKEERKKLSKEEALELIDALINRLIEIAKEENLNMKWEKFEKDLRVTLLKGLEGKIKRNEEINDK